MRFDFDDASTVLDGHDFELKGCLALLCFDGPSNHAFLA
jgi:hypothetical protein